MCFISDHRACRGPGYRHGAAQSKGIGALQATPPWIACSLNYRRDLANTNIKLENCKRTTAWRAEGHSGGYPSGGTLGLTGCRR